jgi:hypothetical protein
MEGSRLNIRRGLFRFWLVLSVLFIACVTVINFDWLKKDIELIRLQWAIRNDDTIIPFLCGQARGKAGVDYTTKQNQGPGPWDNYATPNPDDTCYYMSLPSFRAFFPEYNDLQDNVLIKRLYNKVGIPLNYSTNQYINIVIFIIFALSIPIIFLVLGASLIWAASGFKSEKNRKS